MHPCWIQTQHLGRGKGRSEADGRDPGPVSCVLWPVACVAVLSSSTYSFPTACSPDTFDALGLPLHARMEDGGWDAGEGGGQER